MSEEAIEDIKGVGKAIAGKIKELLQSGKMATLEKYREMTPEGIQEMLLIKGFGPKKIKVIWQDLGVESIGELLYAVNENRLIELNGFGSKTQEDLRQKLEYFQKNRYQFHHATILEEAHLLIPELQKVLPAARIEVTGALRRAANTSNAVELIIGSDQETLPVLQQLFPDLEQVTEQIYRGNSSRAFPFIFFLSDLVNFGSNQFKWSTAEVIIKALAAENVSGMAEETMVFDHFKLPFIAPELRETTWALELAQENRLPTLIETSDIKGVVHAHSTYSDGLQTLAEMAEYAQAQGFEYLVMTDHSKSAFYANGLKPNRVLQQFAEIDQLNAKFQNFKILKGIESDILSDGSLDYDDDLLAQFDVIIASVHSNLRMDEAKATERILGAIKNPYTHILGHPTGRLLLSRKGYPLDHKTIIDACADYKVSIELNANPYRLDLDWSWIPYAVEKGVLISINPDAHSTAGIHHIEYGVASARKGGLDAVNCLNTKGLADFLLAIKKG
jgi:DNA polymerase (family 10)